MSACIRSSQPWAAAEAFQQAPQGTAGAPRAQGRSRRGPASRQLPIPEVVIGAPLPPENFVQRGTFLYFGFYFPRFVFVVNTSTHLTCICWGLCAPATSKVN